MWFLSPVSRMKWIPYACPFVGASCLLYLLPALFGGGKIYFLQALLSFMSDYVRAGKDSAFHPLDRTCASILVFITVLKGIHVIGFCKTALWASVPFLSYSSSVRCIQEKDFDSYRLSHIVWHVSSVSAIVYVSISSQAM